MSNDISFSSDFWSWWIIVLTLGNIAFCWWLIVWTTKKRSGEAATGDVTGHTWDESLQEYNNPLPRWWLWMFYITMIFGVIYLLLYPGLGKFPGLLGWTGSGQYEREMERAEALYGPIFAAYASRDIEDLARDAEAVQVGQRLFTNYCATCHGADAGGGIGFPSLRNDDWLWGGTPAAIKTSILDGRMGIMPPWQAALGDQGVDEVTAYVLALNGRAADPRMAEAGQVHFQTMCAACHMPDGSGQHALGAPNLTNNIWLYGGSPGAIRQSIAQGRRGNMPAHRDFLGEDKAHVLAAYIYSLSQ
jgi:cytochrome c oxidase cbb3-type subunit 3